MSTRIVLPFDRSTIGTPGAQYGDRTYWAGVGANRRQVTSYHGAVDLQVAAGSAVRAAAAGTVVAVSHSRVRGYMVAIDHGDGTGHRVHMLASRGRPDLGARVRQGDIIGHVAHQDEWGSSSNGAHIHLEYRTNGAILGETTARANTPNPLDYIATAPAGGNSTPLEGFLMALSDQEQEKLASDVSAIRTILGGSARDKDGDGKQDETGVINRLRDLQSDISSVKSTTAWNKQAIAGTSSYQGVRPYLRTILSGVQALIAKPVQDVDEKRLAAEVVPALAPLVVEALASKGLATGEDLDEVRASILGALAELPEDVLGAFGLQRAKS